MFTVGNNVLDQDSWSEVATSKRKSTVMSLVDGLQDSAFYLADAMLAATRPSNSDNNSNNSNKRKTAAVTRVIPRENVLLEVQVSRESAAVGGGGSDAVFPTSGYLASEAMAERIVIPKRSVDELRNEHGEV